MKKVSLICLLSVTLLSQVSGSISYTNNTPYVVQIGVHHHKQGTITTAWEMYGSRTGTIETYGLGYYDLQYTYETIYDSDSSVWYVNELSSSVRNVEPWETYTEDDRVEFSEHTYEETLTDSYYDVAYTAEADIVTAWEGSYDYTTTVTTNLDHIYWSSP